MENMDSVVDNKLPYIAYFWTFYNPIEVLDTYSTLLWIKILRAPTRGMLFNPRQQPRKEPLENRALFYIYYIKTRQNPTVLRFFMIRLEGTNNLIELIVLLNI